MRFNSIKPSFLIVFVVLALAGASSFVSGAVLQQQSTVKVNIGINYGSGSIEWHNDTIVPSGEFLLNATMRIARVEFVNFPGFPGPGLAGAFVTGINDVRQNPSANLYWTFWVYNSQNRLYEITQVGAGSYALKSDQTIQWYYQNSGSLTNPALPPNTSVSLSVRLDSSTDPPTAVISGLVHPPPNGPVNVTLQYSSNQGATYQEFARIVSSSDGTFSYAWKLPSGGMFFIMANAQGVKSSPVSIGTGGGIPGFPVESIAAGIALGMFVFALRRKPRLHSLNDR